MILEAQNSCTDIEIGRRMSSKSFTRYVVPSVRSQCLGHTNKQNDKFSKIYLSKEYTKHNYVAVLPRRPK